MANHAREQAVMVEIEDVSLSGTLGIPQGAQGVVIFAHGSGSSRFSPRNNYVARVLRQGGIGTLLFDLLTAEEDRDYERRFDIGLLTERLIGATGWLQQQAEAGGLAIGYFGASTGSARGVESGGGIGHVDRRGGLPRGTPRPRGGCVARRAGADIAAGRWR